MHIEEVFSQGFVILALASYVITRIVRSIVEQIKPGSTSMTLWKKLLLPLISTMCGCGLAMLSSVVPVGLDGTVVDRLIFGCIAGGFATVAYRAVAGFMKKKFDVDVEEK